MDDSWTGRRWVGGLGGEGDRIDHLELGLGDVYDSHAQLVRVETRPTTRERPDHDIHGWEPRMRRRVATNLVQHLWIDTQVYLNATPSTFQSENPTEEWDQAVLPVDSESMEFWMLRAGAHWIAMGLVGKSVLGFQGRDVEPADVRPQAVADLDEYLTDNGQPGA